MLISNVVYSQADIGKYQELKKQILTETKEGGKLDFFTPIKGHEYDGVQSKARIVHYKTWNSFNESGKGKL